jgi:hypothetical protein
MRVHIPRERVTFQYVNSLHLGLVKNKPKLEKPFTLSNLWGPGQKMLVVKEVPRSKAATAPCIHAIERPEAPTYVA